MWNKKKKNVLNSCSLVSTDNSVYRMKQTSCGKTACKGVFEDFIVLWIAQGSQREIAQAL